MPYPYTCFWVFLLISVVSTRPVVAQTPLPTSADRQKVSLLQNQLRQAERKNRRLLYSIGELTGQVRTQADSIKRLTVSLVNQKTTLADLKATVAMLNASLADIRAQNQAIQKTLTERSEQIEKSRQQLTLLEYDRSVLADRAVLRIYKLSPTGVRQRLMAALSKAESGFKYDDDATVRGAIRIVRTFDNQVEAWWMFDKTIDSVLELTLVIQPHRFNPQRCLLLVTAKLLQKSRFSNKPFEEQTDEEKIALYRDKSMRLLEEGDLRTLSDK
jgi:hypothetical protein